MCAVSTHTPTRARSGAGIRRVDNGGVDSGRSEHGALTGGHLHEQARRAGFRLERDGDRVGVPRDACRTLVHEVAGVRHQRIEPRGMTAPQLTTEAVGRARAQVGIRRREVDEIRIVRAAPAHVRGLHRAAESFGLRGIDVPFEPAIRLLGEHLRTGCADLARTRCRFPRATRNRYMCSKRRTIQRPIARIHHDGGVYRWRGRRRGFAGADLLGGHAEKDKG